MIGRILRGILAFFIGMATLGGILMWDDEFAMRPLTIALLLLTSWLIYRIIKPKKKGAHQKSATATLVTSEKPHIEAGVAKEALNEKIRTQASISVEPSQNNTLATVDSESSLVHIEIIPDCAIPQETLDLLWFKNGLLKNYSDQPDFRSPMLSVDLGRSEPSLIDLNLPVASNNAMTPPPGYYPSYAKLTPQQRYIYLTWLKDITSPADLGYIYLFYYGLERHLILGKFEEAFHMIQTLLRHHPKIGAYAHGALLIAIFVQKRVDYFNLLDLDKLPPDERLFTASMMNKELSSTNIIDAHTKFSFNNRRYISGHRELFKETLEEIMIERYGTSKFQVLESDFSSITETITIPLANYSLDQRFLNIPNIATSQRVSIEINSLLVDSHEKVKVKLREIRKATNA